MVENKEDIINNEKMINLNANFNQLKGGEYKLKGVVLSDGKKRCSLDLKRDWIELKDWIIVGGQTVWGTVGFNWRYYYRFHSYYRKWWGKSERDTYFNWKTKQLQIGGNNGFWYLNYYNANPATERSNQYKSLFTFVIYEAVQYGVAPGTPPNVSMVNVSAFWSDYMSSTHGTLVYP